MLAFASRSPRLATVAEQSQRRLTSHGRQSGDSGGGLRSVDEERRAGASARASRHLASDAVLVAGNQEVKGHDSVLARITGQWPQTPVYTIGGWSAPQPDGDRLKVHADFPAMGAAVKEVNLTFSFNAAGQISRVEQQNVMPPAMEPTDKITDFVKSLINGALANGTPIVVCYVNENGQPVQSLRGSTQVFSDNQLCIWVRSGEGGSSRRWRRTPACRCCTATASCAQP